jgi:hypothetical protein
LEAAVDAEDVIASLGHRAWRDPRADLRPLLEAPRPPAHAAARPALIDEIARSWVDEIRLRRSPFRRGNDLDEDDRAAFPLISRARQRLRPCRSGLVTRRRAR